MKTEEKMLHILEKNCADALESGILVALSGGADSCAPLFFVTLRI